MARKRTGGKRPPSEQPVEIRVSWGPPQDAPTVYANQLLISHAGPEFYLVFGELVPPLVLNKSEVPDHLEIKPVIKVVVTNEVMLQFADAIEQNVKHKQIALPKGGHGNVN